MANIFFVRAGSDFRGADFGRNAFEMNARALKSLVDQAVVAVFVIGGNPAFVPEVEAGRRPGPREGGETLVEGAGGGAAGEGNVKSAAFLEGGASEGFPAGDHGVEPGSGFRKLVQKHKSRLAKWQGEAMSNSAVEAGSFGETG